MLIMTALAALTSFPSRFPKSTSARDETSPYNFNGDDCCFPFNEFALSVSIVAVSFALSNLECATKVGARILSESINLPTAKPSLSACS